MIKIVKKQKEKEYLLGEVADGDTFRLASGCGGLYAKLRNYTATETLCYCFSGSPVYILNTEKCILVDCEVHWEDRK